MKPKEQHQFRLWFDRLLSKSLLQQLGILAIGLILAFVVSFLLLSFSGAEWQAFCDAKKMSPWLLPLYLLIDSNALNNLYIDSDIHGWMLFASSITFLVGAFIFNGAIIGIITNSIEQRVTNHREGHIHYLKSGHYIIMGYDDMVPSIITHIFEKDPEAYVLLLSAADAPYIKEKLNRTFSEAQLKRVIINYGHRMSVEYYKDIRLEASEEVFIVGQRSVAAHDAINVECVDSICRYLKQPGVTDRPKRITCVFEDLDTYAAFKTSEIFSGVKDLDIEFVPYNFYAGWAKQVFVMQYHKDLDSHKREIKYPAVYGKGITPDDKKYVHLVFVGTTNFAVAFAMEAANVLHFPDIIIDKEQNKYKTRKTRITFIDVNADKEKNEFITRYRHFFEIQPYYYRDLSTGGEYDLQNENRVDDSLYFSEKNGYSKEDYGFLDVEFEFIKGDVFAANVQDVIRKWAQDEKQYLSIFIALSNQRQNFAFGMNMPDEVYDREIPVFIRQDRSDNFVTNLRDTDEAIRIDDKKKYYSVISDNGELKETILGGRYANIYPFGMNETAFCADDHSLKCAKLINYLYSTMSDNSFQSIDVLNSTANIWEKIEEKWKKLPVALKWSNLYNAYAISVKLATLRVLHESEQNDTNMILQKLTSDEIEMLARVEHNRWNVEKLLMGYRKPHRNEDKYSVKDVDLSTVMDEKAKKKLETDLKRNKQRYIHHDIRPYDQLDGVQKIDCEFARYLHWILKMSGK